MIKTYPTEGILSTKQAQSMLSKLIYSIEGISGCRLDPQTQEIVVELLPVAKLFTIDKTIEALIMKERNNRIIGSRTYIDNESGSGDGDDGEMKQISDLFADDGSVRRDFAVTLNQQIDRILAELSVRHSAKLRSYPSMIPIPVLQKCSYISAFPQNIHFVSEFPHSLQALEKIRETGDYESTARLSAYALSPAVCFHCYAELSESRLTGPLVLTARGTCFRHEASWRLGKHRLNEFSMREIVLFGDSQFIETKRKQFMEEVWMLFESLGLKGRIETASDPFYFSEESAKGQLQIMGNMKYELVVNTGATSGSFSIASFNNMEDSLCRPFHVVGTDYKPMHSGCIAFGIDRWVYALLACYGNDYNNWPIRVKEILEQPAANSFITTI
ncbi:amino acid--ACP ligase [Paenibacillus sp. sptzw28]|uniref:aminoacyl--tRNA ligase-related protein n=1 Tax=Paenibacillus sp. sptzw28 TaxID=715179 RepID=UPI001C6F4B0A|nr:aminoacyl--tRNA ligase-related protein [Paenibacillus sp. sptzw28]QYR19385.1 amino acid--ACP ligase [Paenibacillus sp. sptzw28]